MAEQHGIAISLSNASPSSSSSSSDHHTPHTTGSSAHRRPPPSPAGLHSQPPQLPSLTPQSKKPRGRPPGSKNKPKPHMTPNPAHEAHMKPIIIDVAPGNDVVEAVVSYARRRHLNLTLLSASGTVTNVTLCHALTQAPVFSLHGPFAIMSLTGTYLYNYHFAPPSTSSSPNPNPPYCFGITLSGSQGQVFGGIIGGKAIAGNGVSVTATTFKTAEFYKADAEEQNIDNNNNNNNNNSNPNASDHGAGGNSNMTGFNVGDCPVSGW